MVSTLKTRPRLNPWPQITRAVILILTSLTSGQALAFDFDPAAMDYKAVQVGGVSAFQGDGYSGGVTLRFLPSYKLSEPVTVGIALDASYLKFDTDSNFVALGYMAYARTSVFEKVTAQLNIGAKTWLCDGCGTKLVAGPSVSYDIEIERSPWLKNLWLAYLPVFRDPVDHEVQAGIGIHF